MLTKTKTELNELWSLVRLFEGLKLLLLNEYHNMPLSYSSGEAAIAQTMAAKVHVVLVFVLFNLSCSKAKCEDSFGAV